MEVKQKSRYERNFERAVKLTQELVRIPSVYRPGEPMGMKKR